MKTLNIDEAKTHLSRLGDRAARGEAFVIAKAGKPLVRVSTTSVPWSAGVLAGWTGAVPAPLCRRRRDAAGPAAGTAALQPVGGPAPPTPARCEIASVVLAFLHSGGAAMATLNIKTFPDRLYRKIKRRAGKKR